MSARRQKAQLARLVRGRRLEMRLTQRQAAQAAGISLATWQSLERAEGPHRFLDLTLSAAAHALDLPLAEVLAAAGRPVDRRHFEDAVALPQSLQAFAGLLQRLEERSERDALFVIEQAGALANHLLARR